MSEIYRENVSTNACNRIVTKEKKILTQFLSNQQTCTGISHSINCKTQNQIQNSFVLYFMWYIKKMILTGRHEPVQIVVSNFIAKVGFTFEMCSILNVSKIALNLNRFYYYSLS